MTIVCLVCGYDKNPDGSEFCEACGAELPAAGGESVPSTQVQSPEPMPTAPQPEPPIPIPQPSIPSPPPPATAATARLIAKQPNAPVPEFTIDGNAVIGIFDPDLGPVDIDLEEFPGNETVSRNHAEIYQEGGVWKIKDLGSTNGVFIKPASQNRFGARITTPETLNPGDEIAIAKVRFLFQSP